MSFLQSVGEFNSDSSLTGFTHALAAHAPSQSHTGGCTQGGCDGFSDRQPRAELLRLLLLAGFPEPEAMEPVRCTRVGGQDVPWQAFVRRREMEERRPAVNGAGYGFRIVLG